MTALLPRIVKKELSTQSALVSQVTRPSTRPDACSRNRARTEHPEKAGGIGRTDYWYEDKWTAWHERYLRGKAESLTQVDRGGNPDALVDAAEAARMLRYASRDVIHAYGVRTRYGRWESLLRFGVAGQKELAVCSRAT